MQSMPHGTEGPIEEMQFATLDALPGLKAGAMAEPWWQAGLPPGACGIEALLTSHDPIAGGAAPKTSIWSVGSPRADGAPSAADSGAATRPPSSLSADGVPVAPDGPVDLAASPPFRAAALSLGSDPVDGKRLDESPGLSRGRSRSESASTASPTLASQIELGDVWRGAEQPLQQQQGGEDADLAEAFALHAEAPTFIPRGGTGTPPVYPSRSTVASSLAELAAPAAPDGLPFTFDEPSCAAPGRGDLPRYMYLGQAPPATGRSAWDDAYAARAGESPVQYPQQQYPQQQYLQQPQEQHYAPQQYPQEQYTRQQYAQERYTQQQPQQYQKGHRQQQQQQYATRAGGAARLHANAWSTGPTSRGFGGYAGWPHLHPQEGHAGALISGTGTLPLRSGGSSIASDETEIEHHAPVGNAAAHAALDGRKGLKALVSGTAEDILRSAAGCSLKAVELANTLRSRLGTEALGAVRKQCGGLLSLLESQPKVFIVRRIPKSDIVTLRRPPQVKPAQRHAPPQAHGPPPPPYAMAAPVPRHVHYPPGLAPQGAAQAAYEGPPGHYGSPRGDGSYLVAMDVAVHRRRAPSGELLEALTVEAMVPTQAWNADPARDAPFVAATLETLEQLGGTATISKLRGHLKHRLHLSRSVKTVPLKAFMRAYCNIFMVNGNTASLVEQPARLRSAPTRLATSY